MTNHLFGISGPAVSTLDVHDRFTDEAIATSAMLEAPSDLRGEDVAEPKMLKTTDAIVPLTPSSICGSGLRPYRGAKDVTAPMPWARDRFAVSAAIHE